MSAIARRPAGALTRYDPERGLKTIALMEAAERHFRRARNTEQLLAAVEAKLTAQREFVTWWDRQDKHPGSRTGAAVSDRKRPVAGQDGLPDRLTLHRWRRQLKTPEAFAQALAQAQEACVRACEARRGEVYYTEARSSRTGEQEWYTPGPYVEAARQVLEAIDLDPASSETAQQTVRAARYLTKADDGLRHEWHGRVWLNPPYTTPTISQFVDKLLEEYRAGRTTAAILLTHSYTDTSWFHRALAGCSGICFTRGRIGFLRGGQAAGAGTAPAQGQSFVYFGPDLARFGAVFAAFGSVSAWSSLEGEPARSPLP